MAEYRDLSTGKILDPYQVLKVTRKADRQEIKQAYRALSRRYHPDVMIHRDILPGSCNNLEDVRNQWERVKLSYEILSDPLRRKRYDRIQAWTDPGRAVQRAATEAALDVMGTAVVSAGQSVWGIGTSIGSTVLKEVARAAEQARQDSVRRDGEKKKRNSAVPNKTAEATTSSIMIWRPDDREGGKDEKSNEPTEMDLAVRSRMEKNRGLRSLYEVGMLPSNNKML